MERAGTGDMAISENLSPFVSTFSQKENKKRREKKTIAEKRETIYIYKISFRMLKAPRLRMD